MSADADRVHHVVDVADDDGDQRLEAGEQGALGVGLDRAEQHLGIAEHAAGGRPWTPGSVMSTSPRRSTRALESGSKPEAYSPIIRSSALADVGNAEHGVVGDLVQADPQAQVALDRSTSRRRTRRRWGARAGARRTVCAGTGRSYWPKLRWARWPIIPPAVTLSIIGAIAPMS